MRLHKPPFELKELKIEVTYQCELACIHCSSEASSTNALQMSTEDCLRIIEEAALMGVEDIAFSGGEALLWKGLPKALKFCKSKRIRTTLYTTGICDVPGIITNLNGLDTIVFSVYSGSAQIHDSITATNGSFDKTICSINEAVSAGIQTELHFVPMSNNYVQLANVVELGKRCGVKKISVLRLVPQGRNKGNALFLDPFQNLELRKSIFALREHDNEVRVGSPYNIFMIKDSPSCAAGITKLTISPDMCIYPCDAFKQITPAMLGLDDPFWNIKNKSLANAWNQSHYLAAIRNYLMTDFASCCANCKYIDKCLSGCVAQKYYKHGYLAKTSDPMCLKPHLKEIA